MPTAKKKKPGDEEFLELLHSVPQRVFNRLVGARSHHLREVATRHGWQWGRLIDLESFTRVSLDIMRDKARREKNEQQHAGNSSTEKWQKERARLLELERLKKEGALVDVADLRALLSETSSILRKSHERLQREFGVEAYRIVDEALDEVDAAIVHFCEEEADGA